MVTTSLMFAACSGAGTANVAKKTGNTVNTMANSTGNAVNTISNAISNTTNANTNSNSNSTAMTGDVLKTDEAGIQMTVPKGFKFSKDGEDTIVQSEDEGVDIRFTVPKDGDYNKAITDAAGEVDDYLKDVKVTDKGSKVDVNGMEGTQLEGTAKNEGEDVVWNLTIIKAPKKLVLANFYGEKASMEKYSSQVEQFFKSIKKQ